MPEEIKDIRAEVVVSDSKEPDIFLVKEIVDGKVVASAIQPQKTLVMPNAVFMPQALIQTGMVNGQPCSSMQIIVATANIGNDGKWIASGQSRTIHLSNIAILDEDIAHLSKELGAVYSNLVAIVAEINKIRQVI